ncbi:MAG: hypothetical protein MR406_06235 [Blautia sp.]|nr:hypothetical protein [Blautia sp.]MDD7728494.1 hypothetical protein [Clostridia bacterium]MDY5663748.1 hypothetical protein [Blautia sp.]
MKTISKKKLPIGIDIFEKVRLEDFYYIDKTGFIVEQCFESYLRKTISIILKYAIAYYKKRCKDMLL